MEETVMWKVEKLIDDDADPTTDDSWHSFYESSNAEHFSVEVCKISNPGTYRFVNPDRTYSAAFIVE